MHCVWTAVNFHGQKICGSPWQVHGPVDYLPQSPWNLVIIVDFLWTFRGLSADKIYNFAVGLTQNQKVRGKSTESPQKSMGTQKSMESMGSIWNRWGSVKTSRNQAAIESVCELITAWFTSLPNQCTYCYVPQFQAVGVQYSPGCT